MRREFAKRFAKNRSLLDVEALFAPFHSVELIGQSGFSMRVSVEEAEIPVLERALQDDFIVEPDYVMRLLTPGHPARPARKAAGTRGR